MKTPVLYFVIGMLMHFPIISQPTEMDKEDRKIPFSMEYPYENFSRLNVKDQSQNLTPYPQPDFCYLKVM